MTAIDTQTELTIEGERQKNYAAMLAETDAMRRAFEAMHPLSRDAKKRVMAWLDTAIWQLDVSYTRDGTRYHDEPPF